MKRNAFSLLCFFAGLTFKGQVSVILCNSYYVTSKVGDIDTIGILQLRGNMRYQFRCLNGIDYSSETACPFFLKRTKGRYRIEQVVKGSYIIDFLPERKIKSFRLMLSTELGIHSDSANCFMSDLNSSFGSMLIRGKR
jgi:hypothetical protein